MRRRAVGLSLLVGSAIVARRFGGDPRGLRGRLSTIGEDIAEARAAGDRAHDTAVDAFDHTVETAERKVR